MAYSKPEKNPSFQKEKHLLSRDGPANQIQPAPLKPGSGGAGQFTRSEPTRGSGSLQYGEAER